MKKLSYVLIFAAAFTLSAAFLFSGCENAGTTGIASDSESAGTEISTAEISESEPVTREDIVLSEEWSLTRTTFSTENHPETSVYLVGGIHGNETAGWMAADRLTDSLSDGSEELPIGHLSIVAPVNAWGAEQDKRTTYGNVDINRSFPGDPEGSDGEQIAAVIFEDIRAQKPDLVLDLHEAQLHTDGSDSLGDSIICGREDGIEDLVLDLLTMHDEDPDFPKLNIFSSPPEGSINRTVGEMLEIPVITIETRREEPLEQRIYCQLRIIGEILAWMACK